MQQCGSLVCFQLFLENIGVSYTNAMFIFLDCSALTAQEESTWVSYMPEEKIFAAVLTQPLSKLCWLRSPVLFLLMTDNKHWFPVYL